MMLYPSTQQQKQQQQEKQQQSSIDPTSPHYRPMVRCVGDRAVGLNVDVVKSTGALMYPTTADAGRPVHQLQTQTSRFPSGWSAEREPVESYVYEYEAWLEDDSLNHHPHSFFACVNRHLDAYVHTCSHTHTHTNTYAHSGRGESG